MDALIITLIVVAAVNAIGTVTTAIASIFWNAKIREAKDTQIQTIRDSKDSEILSLQRQLEDAKEMNDVRFREVANVQKEGLKEYIDQIEPQLQEAKAKLQEAEGKVTSLEASAVEGERARELEATERQKLIDEIFTTAQSATKEFDEALKRVKDLEDQQAEAEKDRDAAERLSRPGRTFIRYISTPGGASL